MYYYSLILIQKIIDKVFDAVLDIVDYIVDRKQKSPSDKR